MIMIKKWLSRMFGIAMTGTAGTGNAGALTKVDQDDLIACIRPLVWGGFESKGEIREICEDHLGQRDWTVPERAWLDQELARQWTKKKAAEKTWPMGTAFDRIDRVFKNIEQSGIMALHRAGNTQSDGWDDARQFWDEQGGASSSLHGVVFYHGQDVERVLEDKSLLLTFGPFAGSKLSAMDIAARTVAALTAAGFTVTPPPDESQRIEITGLDWTKRSPDE
jgi:hypothetical protein